MFIKIRTQGAHPPLPTVLILLLFFLSLFFWERAYGRSGSPERKEILLAKGSSILENEVARIVTDSLHQRGLSVKIVHTDTLARENTDSFRVSVIFNAMKSGKFVEPARRFLQDHDIRKTNILLFTVYGELYDSPRPAVDAVTAATTSLNPWEISEKILKSVYAILSSQNRNH